MSDGLTAPHLALIVDRDADTRAMYGQYFRAARCEVEEASDGREALAKALTVRPGVIVTETRLPGIDGYELCGLLRRDPETRDIPIVVVTADTYPPHIERARQSGADSVLIKPCLPDVLWTEVRRLADKSAHLRERGTELRGRIADQLSKSDELLDRSNQHRRRFLARTHNRRETTSPELAPPDVVCPSCDRQLVYRRSHVGGVSERHSEQWDYYECAAGCGTFQYRQRTRKLRKVS
jgi:CheY-like chemotaxis protein